MKRVWSDEKEQLLREKYPTAHLASLAVRIGVTETAMKSRAKRLGLRREVNAHEPWTQQQLDYLREHYATMSAKEIAQVAGHHESSIYKRAKDMGLKKHPDFIRELGRRNSQHPNAVAHRFFKCMEPKNKGKRIEQFMSAKGIASSSEYRFKKGSIPHNRKPIGHERINSDGYIYMKIAHGQPFVLKHRYIWEEHYGQIPDGHCIAFRDGNRLNCDISNLMLISREDNCRRRAAEETPEQRRERIEKATKVRNRNIRRDKLRIHWGMEPIGKLVKRW